VRTELSWVRAGYLAAFAVLGWRYILQPLLDPIRTQLARPDTETLPSLVMYDYTAVTSHREIMFVDTPASIRSIVVSMGPHVVFLPGLWDNPLSCDELAQALKRCTGLDGQLNVPITGKEVDWPRQPTYQFDKVLKSGAYRHDSAHGQ